MKIAYMIETHTDVKQLIRLCEALVLSGDVFIHVDKKTTDAAFWEYLNAYKQTKSNVNVLSQRHFVAWGGVFASKMLSVFIESSLRFSRKVSKAYFAFRLGLTCLFPSKHSKFLCTRKRKRICVWL